MRISTFAAFCSGDSSFDIWINWQVLQRKLNVLHRLQAAMQLNIPLLAHEAVTTLVLLCKIIRCKFYFAPHQSEVTWQSTISDFNDLTLLALIQKVG